MVVGEGDPHVIRAERLLFLLRKEGPRSDHTPKGTEKRLPKSVARVMAKEDSRDHLSVSNERPKSADMNRVGQLKTKCAGHSLDSALCVEFMRVN